MAAANIKINGVALSNDDLPINTLLTLDNQNTGGELTFAWSILDQPPGAVDALSSAVIQNPTFTPKKEGTYLIKLVVNSTLPSEVSDTKIAAIRFLKTRLRAPAAGETVQIGSRGWAGAVGDIIIRADGEAADEGGLVGVVATGAPNINVNDVLRAVATETIKSGLPGQESITGWQRTDATVIANVDQMLAICLGAVDGGAGPYAPGRLILIRIFGSAFGFVGVPVTGDPVYVSDAGAITLTPGTVTRQIGNVTRVGGGTYDAWIDGTYGSTVSLTSTPPVNVNKGTALAGGGTTAARHNHKHDIDTAAASSITVAGSINAEGILSSLARADHTHAVVTISGTIQETAADAGHTGAATQGGTAAFVFGLATAGIYHVVFNCAFTNGGVNNDTNFDLRFSTAFTFGSAAVQAQTVRQQRSAAANSSNTICIASRITVGAAGNLYVGVGTVGGTTTLQAREMYAMKVA